MQMLKLISGSWLFLPNNSENLIQKIKFDELPQINRQFQHKYVNLSTEPSTKSLVPTIDIRSATRWLWEIILNAWKLY